jgi:hypothetical protein
MRLLALGLTAAAAVHITPTRLGDVHLGDRAATLKAYGRVGALSPGCELTGRREYGAALRAPLSGTLTFNAAKRVTNITADRGVVTNRGVRIGTRASAVLRAYPGARYDRPMPGAPIDAGFITAKLPTGTLTFAIAASTRRVFTIGAPTVPVCE